MNEIAQVSVVDLLSFATTVASLVLSIVAIWIALHFKRESDRVNELTRDLLTEIRSDAKTISQIAMPELRAYGETSRQLIASQASQIVRPRIQEAAPEHTELNNSNPNDETRPS